MFATNRNGRGVLKFLVLAAFLLARVGFCPAEEPAAREELSRQTAPAPAPVPRPRLEEFRQRLRQQSNARTQLPLRTWKVQGAEREALVYRPRGTVQGAPVIFAFHGHGGTAGFAARHFRFHEIWPEAICVYPQGLPTPVPVIDPEGKMSGWQKSIGDQQDRDLELFDAILNSLSQKGEIDPKRVFVAGHSNGGFFAYVLMAARGDQLAAIAPVAAMNGLRDAHRQTLLPVMHVAGRQDSIVPFQFQLGTIERLKKANGCDEAGVVLDDQRTLYPSADGADVLVRIHPGGHEIPAEASEQIVAFFRGHQRE